MLLEYFCPPIKTFAPSSIDGWTKIVRKKIDSKQTVIAKYQFFFFVDNLPLKKHIIIATQVIRDIQLPHERLRHIVTSKAKEK